ncbi:MAG: protein-export chaperone SecB [Alphaproteobacteria bacterium]
MQPQILINTQYIKDFSLEIPGAPEIFKELKEQPSLNIDVSIKTKNLEDDFYEVIFNTSINADTKTSKFFIIELAYGCVVKTDAKDNELKEILNIFVPQQLFPFIRSTIANSMVSSGLAPIMLPPIDFLSLYKEKNAK